jgi:hypothetical protein
LRDDNLVFSFERGQRAVLLSSSVPVFRIDAEGDALYAILNQGIRPRGGLGHASGPNIRTEGN